MEQTIDIQAFLRAYRRRWWLIVLPLLLIGPVVAAIAYSLPAVYLASARILVESQQIPSELAQTTVTAGVEQRIALIRQRLTARETLLDIAARFNVFKDRPEMSPSDIVAAMREATIIQGVTLGRRRGPVTSIEISYTDANPATTARVANEFLTLLLEQNIRQRNEQAVETVAFFDREVDRLGGELSELETAIAAFKNENQNALPDSLATRRAELLALQQRQFEREVQRADLVKRKAALEQALADGDFSLAAPAQLPTEEIELRRLSAELVQARSVYAESHPRIRLLTSRIRVLEAALAKAGAAPTPAPETPRIAGADPAAETRRAIEEIEAEMTLLEDRRGSEVARIAELEASIGRTPDVELRLNALQRRYSSVQSQHADAVSKRAQAQIGERLEINQQAERFEVVEQAQTPSAPIAPNRKLIVAGGAFGALALGFALVTLLELANRTIRSADELERALNVRPLATIPYIATAREVALRAWTRRIVMVGALVLLPLGVFAVDQLVAPLPVLIERVLSASGIEALAQKFGITS